MKSAAKRTLFIFLIPMISVAPMDAAAIYTADGTLDGPCAWASVVRVGVTCSGTLISPGAVLTAGHCDKVVAHFGEAGLGEGGSEVAVGLVDCEKHYDYVTATNGVDLRVCKIDPMDTAPNVPIVPIMVPTGPARDWFRHEIYGYQYALNPPIIMRPTPKVITVGAGINHPNGDSGDKLQGSAWIERQFPQDGSKTKLKSGDGYDHQLNVLVHADTKEGDSGGPLMTQMRDGSWRQIGVLHGSLNPGPLYHESAPSYLRWIELKSEGGNNDIITPCHEFIDGVWEWQGNCEGSFPLNPDESYENNWNNDCAGVTYGGGLYSNADVVPPGPGGKAPNGEANGSPLVPLDALDIIHLVARAKAENGDFGTPPSPSAIEDYFADKLDDDSVFPFIGMIHDGGNRGIYVTPSLEGDFDGDGDLDAIHGYPYADCGKGEIIEQSSDGTTTVWSRDSTGVLGAPACDDYFGAALSVADFDADGYDDVAIGAPGSDLGGTPDAGSLTILYGSSSGLSASGDQLLDQEAIGIPDSAEDHDFLGEALAAGDFDCDGYPDLAIGIPRENDGMVLDAGAVIVLYGSAGGLSTSSAEMFSQGVNGVVDSAETDDHFGAALASGNFNGDAAGGKECVDLAIGVPFEDIAGRDDAGFVYIMLGGALGLSATNSQRIDQGMSSVADSAESGDHFGANLRVDDGSGTDDLTVQVPGEQCTSGAWAEEGQHLFEGGPIGLSTSTDVLDCENVDEPFNSYEWGVREHAIQYHVIRVIEEL